ncbi:MAG: hypothetical protein LBT36_06405 [Oscillospiraceae bacterium]|jgi:hypothetical protein|nr:hypothetical protein [Oscillospiraceae bacterium]
MENSNRGVYPSYWADCQLLAHMADPVNAASSPIAAGALTSYGLPPFTNGMFVNGVAPGFIAPGFSTPWNGAWSQNGVSPGVSSSVATELAAGVASASDMTGGVPSAQNSSGT